MTTLSLAMIVKDEEEVLGRCLESCASLFDEIIIVDTGSTDKTVEIAKSFPNVQIHYFEWIKDFSAARNYSFSLCTCDYIMWLDADDVIRPHDLTALKRLKEGMLKDQSAILLPYEYAHDQFDNSLLTLYRNRIVKRDIGAEWKDPIHEFLIVPGPKPAIQLEIPIHHYRTAEGVAKDGHRNLVMLEELVKEGGQFAGRNMFYYAKELYYARKLDKAIEVLEEYLSDEVEDWIENKKSGFGLLPECYRQLSQWDKAIEAARRAVDRVPDWVDGYLELASAYMGSGKASEAVFWLEKAAELEKPQSLAPLLNDKYTWIPHQQLLFAYDGMGRYGEAYLNSWKVLRYKPLDEHAQHNIGYLAARMKETFVGKIGWIENSVREWGPARLRHFLVREALEGAGVQAAQVSAQDLKDCTVIIVRFENSSSPNLIKDLQDKGKKVILDVCEDLFEFDDIRPVLIESILKADSVTCCSTALARKISEFNRNVIVIEDPFERPDPEMNASYDKDGELTIVFCGYGGSYRLVKPYENLIRSCGYKILTIHEHDEKYGDISLRWNLETFATEMIKADVAIVVSDLEKQPCKSNNRVTQAMSLGLPVVCSKLEAYSEVVQHGENGFFFSSERDLIEALESLKDKETRKRVGERAKIDSGCYSPSIISGKWLAAAYMVSSDDVLASRKVNLGIIPLDGWENKIPEDDEPIDSLELGVGEIVHLHMSYILEHYKQGDLESMVRRFHSALGSNGKVTVIFTDADLAMRDYYNNELTWDELSKRFFQNGSHKSVVCLDYLAKLFRKCGFKGVYELELVGFPYTIVPDINNPKPEPMQAGLICWKSAKFVDSDPDKRYIKGEVNVEETPELSTSTGGKAIVDLVIPIYNNLEYTKLCIDSLFECTELPFNLILVDAGSTDEKTINYLKDLEKKQHKTKYIRLDRATFAQAVNVGIKAGEAKSVCILNNDIIVSRGWLKKLVECLDDENIATIGPWSNCDQGWKHLDELIIKGVRLHPGMELEQVKDIIPDLYDAQYHKEKEIREVYHGGFNAFYCTLIPRDIINKIGLLDEAFNNGGEDSDWCFRASLAGYKHVQRPDCFIFHFGAKTRKSREDEDSESYHEEDNYNNVILGNKWNKPRLTIFTGQAWEKWTPKNINEGGIGGSETAAAKIAESFVKMGYEVFVFNDCQDEEGVYSGVQYLNWNKYAHWASMNHTDILLASRMVEPFDFPIAAKGRFCWIHDIWLSQDRDKDLRLDKVDKFFCLSPWHKEFFAEYQNCPEDKIFVTTNGIDPDRFKDLDWSKKHPYRFVYSSSPDRGLDCLLEMWPEILRRYPSAELHVFYGFFNWMSSIKARNDTAQQSWAESIMAKLEQPGVVNHDRVGQQELADWYMSSSVWLMPEPFTETNCITAKEAMAAGCMPICSDVAALATTVGPERGIIIPFGNWRSAYGVYKTPEIKQKFLEATFHFLENKGLFFDKLVQNRQEMLTTGTWDAVAKTWHKELFFNYLSDRNGLSICP